MASSKFVSCPGPAAHTLRAARCLLPAAFLLAAGFLLAGCSSSEVHRLTDYEYPSKPDNADIEAFYGEVARPHEKIAIIQSSPSDSRDSATKAKQLDELRRIARRLGADAVQQVRLLSSSGNGLVRDPATPFPAVKQGPFQTFFLRGEAIKFVDPNVDLSQPYGRHFSLSETDK